VGAIESLTNTYAKALLAFPLPSTAVKLTALTPALAHENKRGETVREATPHASVVPESTSLAAMDAKPVKFSARLKFLRDMVGAVTSTTVMVLKAGLALPLTSATVRVMLFADPKSLQLKEDFESVREAMPHASALPLSTLAAVIVAIPAGFKITVRLREMATGSTESATVIVDTDVAVLSLVSVTVRVVDRDPTSAQVKADLESASDLIPHASALALLTSAVEIRPIPDALRETKTLRLLAWGSVVSSTTTPE